jgi:hypothetical protein
MLEGGTAAALGGRGVGGRNAHAEVVAEAGTDFPALELMSPGEGKVIEPGQGRAACTAEQASTSSALFFRACVKGVQ